MRPRKNEYDRTQRMLSGLRHAGDSWILLTRPGLFEIVTGQPILLYALIDRWSLSLLPFKDCLSCIMRAGHDFYAYCYEEMANFRYDNLGKQVCTTAKFVNLNPFSESVVPLERDITNGIRFAPKDHE